MFVWLEFISLHIKDTDHKKDRKICFSWYHQCEKSKMIWLHYDNTALEFLWFVVGVIIQTKYSKQRFTSSQTSFPFLEKRKRILPCNFHIQKAELHKHSKTIHQFVFIENHSLDIPSSNKTSYRIGHESERSLEGFDFKIIEKNNSLS